jgi:putative transposase
VVQDQLSDHPAGGDAVRPVFLVTDKLRSWGVAMKDLRASDWQKTGRWLENRAENSHLAFR